MFVLRSIRSPIHAFISNLLLLLATASLTFFLGTCGGASQDGGTQPPPPPANTVVQFRIGDAYWDRIISVEATLESVFLKNSSGAFVKVVPVSHRFEFTHLAGLRMPIYIANVAQGTYSEARIDGGQIHISYLDNQNNRQEFVSTESASITVPLSSFTVGTTKAIVSIDFDVSRSIAIDPTNQNPPSVNPVFSFSLKSIGASGEQGPENGEVENVTGQVTSVNGSSFIVTTRDGAGTEFATDGNTVFQNVSLGTLPNMLVRVNGVTRTDNSLLATAVEGLENQNGVEMEGLYLVHAGFVPEILVLAHEGVGAGLFTQDEAMGRPMRVNVENATYSINTDGMDMSGIPYTTANIASGAQLRLVSPSLFVRGDTTNLTAEKVILEKQCLVGTVYDYQAGPPAVFQLVFDDNSFLKVLSPALNAIYVHQQPGTHLVNTGSIQNGDVVYVRGLLFMDSGSRITYHMVAQRIWK